MNKFFLKVEGVEYSNKKELENDEIELLETSINHLQNSYAPYSKFHVSAGLELENGEFILGSNQENAAYPSGLCAERVAVFYANNKYPNLRIKRIVIVAKKNGKLLEKPIPPCGACLQVIAEIEKRYNSPIDIILYGTKKIVKFVGIKQLLPLTFDESFLD